MQAKVGSVVMHRAPLVFMVLFGVVLFLTFYLVLSLHSLWLAVFVSFPVSFFGTELLFRILFVYSYGKQYIYKIRPYVLVDNPDTGYSFRKNTDLSKVEFDLQEKYAFNPETGKKLELTIGPQGFRGAGSIEKKGENVYRIYCSGGSTTAGYGVNDCDTWPAQLEKKINDGQENLDYEVINGGVYGWNSSQELASMKKVLTEYEIDAVILHQGWNEEFVYSSMTAGGGWNRRQIGNYYSRYYFFSNKYQFLSPFISLVVLLKKLKRERLLKSDLSFSNASRWLNLKSSDYVTGWFDNLVEIAQLCKDKRIKLYIVKYPSLVNVSDSTRSRKKIIDNSRMNVLHAEYQAIAVARMHKSIDLLSKYFNIIDVSKKFDDIIPDDKKNYFLDEMHLTENGEKLFANEVCKYLLRYSDKKISNKEIDSSLSVKDKIGNNDVLLNKKIDRVWAALNSSDNNLGKNINIPEDHYTVC